MGEVRRRWFLDRGLWLHAGVIPAAFPSGKTGNISGAVDASLEREWTWISRDGPEPGGPEEPGVDGVRDHRPKAFGPRRDLPTGVVNANLEWTWMLRGVDPGRPTRKILRAAVKQRQFHKVPRREVRVPLPCCPPRMAETGQAFNFDNPMLKTEPRATGGKCRTQHDRNVNAVIIFDLYSCKESHTAPRQGADAP